MAGPSVITDDVGALLSTTLRKYSKTMQDNIATSTAILFMIMKRGDTYKVTSDIGAAMAVPLMYELGQTDTYSGYDPLDNTPAEGVTTAFFNYANHNTSIVIAGDEERKNGGTQTKIIDLANTKVKQAELGAQDFFSKRFLYGAGGSTITTPYTSPMNGSTFIDPLPKLIAYDPTASVVVGNINQSTSTWWRNQFLAMNGYTTFAGFLMGLRKLNQLCEFGPGGAPNLHMLTPGTFLLYEAALAAAHRNPSYNEADIPFTNVAFMGNPAVADQHMPDYYSGTVTNTKGSWVMTNSRFFEMTVHSDANFTTTDFERDVSFDGRVAHIRWQGGVGISNRRKHGVAGYIDETIAA